MKERSFGIDFDGTVVKFKFPYIGEEVPHAVRVMKRLKEKGHKLYLNTRRGGGYLREALNWFESQEIELEGWNDLDNHPNNSTYGSSKIPAHYYIDDAAFGCPLTKDEEGNIFVDWKKIEEMLENMGYI